MLYNGACVPPVWRVRSGDTVKVNLHNELSEATNLHFDGLDVSPIGMGTMSSPYRARRDLQGSNQDPRKTCWAFLVSSVAGGAYSIDEILAHSFGAGKTEAVASQ